MGNSYFQFKQFRIEQSDCAMKVGTDGVLLGAWADLKGIKRAIDVGAGTGLLALMLAQRQPRLKIDAVEIEGTCFLQLLDNIGRSPWQDRIEGHHVPIQEYAQQSSQKYDLLISNPPFFQRSSKSATLGKALARHDDFLSQEDLLEASDKLLNENGRLVVIYPPSEANSFQQKAEIKGFFLHRLLNIYPHPRKNIKRKLLDFSRHIQPVEESDLFIELEKRHQYSEEYRKLTKEFYLKF